jgi:uncharacterized protein
LAEEDPVVRLEAIFLYPIKSCRGTPLDQVVIERRGIRGDRRWMVADPEGSLISQRDHPRMALVEPRLGEDGLVVQAPGREPLHLGLQEGGTAMEVEIWGDRCPAVDQGDDAAEWFGSFLGTPVRLVRQDDDAMRPVDPAYARSPGDQVSFADGYPLLLTGTASLDDLNTRLPEPIPMNRFRPNLVVSGARAFEEDAWTRVRIGGVDFHVVKPCARCVVTTVDQGTGTKRKEPLRTLAEFRRNVPGGRKGKGNAVYFGQNLIPDPGSVSATLRAGDEVEVLDRRDPGAD